MSNNFDHLDAGLIALLTQAAMEPETFEAVERVPSGSLALDFATSGGWPRGRYSIIWGKEGSGKSTTCLMGIAEATTRGGFAAWIDVEQSFDESYAAKIGVDISRLYLTRPKTAEQALNSLRTLIKSNGFDMIIFDSVGALAGVKEVAGNIGDTNVAIVARLLKDFVSRVNPELQRTKTAVVFINQLRYKIGSDDPDPETMPGGQAFKHGRAITIKLSPAYQKHVLMDSDEEMTGQIIRGRVTHNRVGPPQRKFEFLLRVGVETGVDQIAEAAPLAKKMGVLQNKDGGVYEGHGNAFFNGLLLGNGVNQVIKFLYTNHDVFWLIEAELRRLLHNFQPPVMEVNDDRIVSE